MPVLAAERPVARLIDERQEKAKGRVDRDLERALDALLQVLPRAHAALAVAQSGLRRDGSSLHEAVEQLDDAEREQMRRLLQILNEYRGVESTKQAFAVSLNLWRWRHDA